MFGLEFHKADNALLCGSAEFEVRRRGRHRDQSTLYRVSFGPNGMCLSKPSQLSASKWVTVTEKAEAEDIEAILPNRSDFGLDWTFVQFMLALTFYGEGHKRGYAQGEWRGRELERNRIEHEQA